jgi:hypothetical protein
MPKKIDHKLRHAYACHKSKAKHRNIEFYLTYDEWLDIWTESGKLQFRGVGKGKFVMSRYNDIGAYEKNNVFIQEFGKNVTEGLLGKPATYIRTPEQRLAQILRVNPNYKGTA